MTLTENIPRNRKKLTKRVKKNPKSEVLYDLMRTQRVAKQERKNSRSLLQQRRWRYFSARCGTRLPQNKQFMPAPPVSFPKFPAKPPPTLQTTRPFPTI